MQHVKQVRLTDSNGSRLCLLLLLVVLVGVGWVARSARAAQVGSYLPGKLAALFGWEPRVAGMVGVVEVSSTAGTITAPTLYTTVESAFTAINNGTHQGVITLTLSGNITETETASLNASGTSSASYTDITIKPASGMAVTVSGSLPTPLIALIGADNVTIDGLNTGGSSLTLTNTSTGTSASTIRLSSGATNNVFTKLTINGSSTGSDGGTIYFDTDAAGSGNDNNQISFCDIGRAGNDPLIAINSSGTSGRENSGNTISNCLIYDFYSSAAANATGVWLDSGNTDWMITGNSFYQTGTRVGTSSTVRAIYINNTSGNNFTVTDNYIGGRAVNAGGTAWTITSSSVAYRFVGIQLNVGTTTPSNVQGNTVKNFSWLSTSTAATLPGVWSGIYVQAGAVNIGTTTGNTIGSGTDTGSVSVTTSGNGGTTFGIGAAGNATRVISNNTIGSITTNGTTTGISVSLVGIQATAGTNTISGNTVGSTTTANSLNASNSSNSATEQQVTGILSSSTGGATITNNTVASLNNNYIGTNAAGQIRGIVVSSGSNTISGNFVHSLSLASSNTSARLTGILANGGSATYQNNLVRLGLDVAGNSLTIGCPLVGLNDAAGTNNFYHNTVLLAGTATGQATWAYLRSASTTTSLRNNIFFNNRTGGSANHFAAGDQALGSGTFSSDYNLFVGTGTTTAANFMDRGTSSSGTVMSFADWQASSGSPDAHSFASTAAALPVANLFVDPLAATPNLHVKFNSVEALNVANSGTPAGVSTDYDGDARNGTMPDIGADESCMSTAPTLVYADWAVKPMGTVTFSPLQKSAAITAYRVIGQGSFNGTVTVQPSGKVTATDAGSTSSNHQITIRGTDDCGTYTEDAFFVTVFECTAITITDSLTGMVAGNPFSEQLDVTPAGAYNFTLSSGALPPGLTLSTSGLLSGTPTAGGNFNFTIRVSNDYCTKHQAFSITVSGSGSCQSSLISLPDIAIVYIGQTYSQSVTATPPDTYKYNSAEATTLSGEGFTFSCTLNTDCTSQTLTTNNNNVTGSPRNIDFVLTATQSSSPNCSGSRGYRLKIRAPLSALALLADYDGDAVSDYVVWAPARGEWHIRQSRNGQTQTIVWGTAGDVPLLGDYDGDGKTDLAVWRPNNGTWYIKQSRSGQALVKHWGLSTDVPVPGDFDGDYKTDIAVWRPSAGAWYVWRSRDQQYETTPWGAGYAPYDDVPLPGDYDGDGVSDLAVFRRANGTWYVKQSRSGAVLVRHWGLGSDVPVPNDYDGDGQTDIAVWRGTEGQWYVMGSRDDQISVKAWGAAYAPYHDVPTPGDYDGDGKADLVVWRPANRTWYVLRSESHGAYLVQPHGQVGARPVLVAQRQ